MTKYKINDQFKSRQHGDSVKLKIIFVPPLDGYGKQHYLCEVFSLYWNGGDKHFYSLDKEENLDKYFVFNS